MLFFSAVFPGLAALILFFYKIFANWYKFLFYKWVMMYYNG